MGVVGILKKKNRFAVSWVEVVMRITADWEYLGGYDGWCEMGCKFFVVDCLFVWYEFYIFVVLVFNTMSGKRF